MNAMSIFERRHAATRAAATALLLLCVAAPSFGAQVFWQDPGTLGAGQTSALELVFEDAEPTEPVALPHIDGVRVVGQPSQASDISIVNGRRSAHLILSYPVRAERTGTVQLPAFAVETSAGTQRVAALAVDVGRATVRDASGAAQNVEDAVQARLTPSTLTPYAGEVVDLDLRITLAGNHSGQVVGVPTWDAGALTLEPWSDGHAVRTEGGNAVRFHSRGVAPQAGKVELAPAEQEVQLETGRGRSPLAGFDPFGAMQRMGGSRLFDSFFGAQQMTSVMARSNAVQLDVRPLPQPAPAGFSGAVGEFTLESTLTPEHPKTGEPVTWTLTLSGTGNWPTGVALPARAVPADLRTLQPKQRSQFGDTGRFSGEVSEDLVIVPNQPGQLALEPVRFVYFNPTSGQYETAEAKPPVLEVTGAPLPAAVNAPVAAAASAPASEPPAAPALAPALPGSGAAMAPLPWSTLRFYLLAPLALAVAYRIGRRAWFAWREHPGRLARRTARRMRDAIVAAQDAVTTEGRLAAVLDWQRAAARVLGVDLAAPTADQLRRISDPYWAEVWAGSERVLFARGHTLPVDWCAQALALCAPSRRRASRAAAARPLIATAATASLLLLALALPSHGAEIDDLRSQVNAAPLDWVARYNLGRAEAEAGNAGRALGAAVAALAQVPRNAGVRANARALLPSLPEAAAATAPLLDGRLAPLGSAAYWQMVLMIGAVLMAAGIAVARRRPTAVLVGAGALLMCGSAAALREHGVFADARAAMVVGTTNLRALPTDAAPADDAPALAAGSVIIAEGDFLGWSRVTRNDGAVGWVRGTDLVPLYAPVAAPRSSGDAATT